MLPRCGRRGELRHVLELVHLLAQGVDKIVVADNRSVDGTREILESLPVTVIDDPEVGYYQSKLFEPRRWKPNYPNLAFERMDEADAYWGAKIVTAFSDELIAALMLSSCFAFERFSAETFVCWSLVKFRLVVIY